MSSHRSPKSSRFSSSRPRRLAAANGAGSVAALARQPLRALDTDAAGFAAFALLGSRVIVWVSGLWAIALFGTDQSVAHAFDPSSLTQPFASRVANALVAPTARFDSVWYLAIAHSGYASAQTTAFFPLYPLLVRGLSVLVGSALAAGVAISFVSMLVAGYLLYRLVALELDVRRARITLLLLAAFPTSLFFSAVYSESLFLALSVGAVYAARRGRWPVAGLLGALATLTRPTGLLLLVALALLLILGPRRLQRASRPLARRVRPAAALWLGLVPAGLALYLVYLRLTGHPLLAPMDAQTYWSRSFEGPFSAAVIGLIRIPSAFVHLLAGHVAPFAGAGPLSWQAYQLLDLPFLAFILIGLWLCWRRLPFAYFAYALAAACEALSYPNSTDPMLSLPRFTLVIFPLFIAWADLLSTRARSRVAMGAASLGLLAFYSGLWAMWSWVA